MNRLRAALENMSLRKTIAAALIIGLAAPVGAAAWLQLTQRRAILLERLHNEHARIVETLASGMQTPLWERRPEAGRPLLEAVLLDPRVTAIRVTAPRVPRFLEIEAPQRRRGALLSLQSPVLRDGDAIGWVRVDMDTGQLQADLASQWRQLLLLCLLQLIVGLSIVFTLLRYKVLAPLRQLLGQTEVLAGGMLDEPLRWRRGDELGVLGRGFENTRQALRDLVARLEQRNRELQEREAEAANQAAALRMILENGGGFGGAVTEVTEAVEARRTAAAAQRLLDAVLDAVPALLHVKDRELRYQLVNQQFLTWSGWERKAALGKTWREMALNSGVEDREDQDRQVLETGRPLPFYEATYPQGSGEPITVWTTKAPLTDADGAVTHIVTVGLDISERKRAEQDRQRWLQLFQDAIESIPNGFAVYDAAKRLVICNSAFAALYGADPAALAGCAAAALYARVLSLIDAVDGQPPEPVGQAPHLADDQWSCSRAPVEIRLKDGRWLLVTRQPTAEGGNVFLRTDITHLKRMEQALRDSEQRFRSIAEAHPVPVIISALEDERLLYVSPGLASLFQTSVAAILARPLQDFFTDPAERSQFRTLLLNQGAVDAFECALRKADGVIFPAAITARRIDYQGTAAAVGGVIDLTAIKRAEQEIARQREALYQSEKLSALGSLLAGVAHELNNPLSVVVGRAIMLESTAAEPDKERIKKLRLAAERCARIVKTFLAIARQQPPERAPVQLNELLTAAVELMGYGLRTADIETALELDPGLPPVLADADQLTQVFTNLLVNAQQALLESPTPRRLLIRTRWRPGAACARVEFIDNGPGVPTPIRPRIFEPFYTSKPLGQGAGIGLSFSYGVVESHGGQLRLEDSPTGGARFVIDLPSSPAPAATPALTPSAAPEAASHAILIVDDEPEIVEWLSELLARDGHRVQSAASGQEALRRLAERDYDLILSDLKMPDLDGPGLYRRLQSAHPRLLERLIFITGDTLGIGTSEFLQQTGRPVLEKPLTPDEVVQVVRRALNPGEAKISR